MKKFLLFVLIFINFVFSNSNVKGSNVKQNDLYDKLYQIEFGPFIRGIWVGIKDISLNSVSGGTSEDSGRKDETTYDSLGHKVGVGFSVSGYYKINAEKYFGAELYFSNFKYDYTETWMEKPSGETDFEEKSSKGNYTGRDIGVNLLFRYNLTSWHSYILFGIGLINLNVSPKNDRFSFKQGYGVSLGFGSRLNDNVMLSFTIRLNRFSPKNSNPKVSGDGNGVSIGNGIYVKEKEYRRLRTMSIESAINYVI